jgi:hypothetical protein
MGGGGGSSSSATTSTTTTNADSFNRTNSVVSNLSDVGNVSLNLGGSPLDADSLVKLLPFAILGGVLLVIAAGVAMRKA